MAAEKVTATVATLDELRCAMRSRRLDEPLGGSAPVATGWICVEHDGPWTPRAPTTAEVGDAVTALRADGVRLQLVRRPSTAAAGLPSPLTVLLAHAAVDPADRWLRRLTVADVPDLLARVHPAVVTSPSPPALGEPVDHDVWLVCTHGRRDACCALHGRPVVTGLRDAGAEAWETTHTGGHRFAATAVLLPDGLALGRLESVPGAALAGSGEQGLVDPALLRGRCALPRPVQAAETALRAHLDEHRRDAVLPTRWVMDGRLTRVELRGEDRAWDATVRTTPVTVPRAVSDGAEPTTPDEHEVVDLAPGRRR